MDKILGEGLPVVQSWKVFLQPSGNRTVPLSTRLVDSTSSSAQHFHATMETHLGEIHLGAATDEANEGPARYFPIVSILNDKAAARLTSDEFYADFQEWLEEESRRLGSPG